MTLLLLGVALWWAAHFFKRAAPGPRAALGDGPGKGVVAVALVISIVLMVLGYRSADPVFLYALGDWTWHLNNLLMLVSIALFGAGNSKSRLRALVGHPMLAGFAVWALAHLLVNGDLPSLILFGGLGLWAVVHTVVLNAAGAPRKPLPALSLAGDIRLLLISVAVMVVVILLHWQVFGVRPFPG